MIDIPALSTAVVVAIMTSFISTYLAFKKYRTEKWWDKKCNCYIETITAINNIIKHCDHFLAEELDDEMISEQIKTAATKKYDIAISLLHTQSNIGELLMSKKLCFN